MSIPLYLNIDEVTRIRKIAEMKTDSDDLPSALVEFEPKQTFQSAQEPYDDLKKVKSSIWVDFTEVYQKYKVKLEGKI